ncbi:hypothetical protein Vadar_002910 [Vaccinium darrowii]|nr:hypothetical protein Vadar_002910 [Vaccinium darrowii]
MGDSQFEDDLSHRLKSFTLTDVEQDDVVLSQDDVVESVAECRSSLFGKVISQKPANLVGLKNTMEKVWGNPKKFRVLAVGDGIFQFVFPSELAATRVLRGKPWFFNNHFLILERWKPDIPPKDYCFNITPMWIQVWGIPLQFLSKDVGVKIGLKFGDVDDVVIPHSGSREGRFLRIRTVVDASQPLKWGLFRPAEYGDWLRASPATQQGRRQNNPTSEGRRSTADSVSDFGESLAENQGSDSRKGVTNSKNCGNLISADLNGVSKNDAHAEMVTEAYLAERSKDCGISNFESLEDTPQTITLPTSNSSPTFTLSASLSQNLSSINSECSLAPKNASLIDIPILVDPRKAKLPRKCIPSVVVSTRGRSGIAGWGRGNRQHPPPPLPSIKLTLNSNGKRCHDPTETSPPELVLSSPTTPILPNKKARVTGDRGAAPHDSSCDMVAETSPKWSPATK